MQDYPYAQSTDCVDIFSSLGDLDDKSSRLESALAESLIQASRLFDDDTLVAPAYYAQTDGIFATRRFYLNGTSFTHLDPFTEIEWIHDSDDELIDNTEGDLYTIDANRFTVEWSYYRNCGGLSIARGFIDVSAKWGYSCVPMDVKQAVKNMGCLLFLTNNQARLGLEDSVTDRQETRMRSYYTRVVGRHRDLHHHKQLGVA